MDLYVVCIGKNDFVASNGKQTQNIIKAKKFADLEQAKQTARDIEQTGQTTMVQKFDITNLDDILEFVAENLETALENWGADVSVGYLNNKVMVCHPNGIRYYVLDLSQKVATI